MRRAPVDVQADEVAVQNLGSPVWQPDPYADLTTLRPHVAGQQALCRDRGPDRVFSPLKHHEERVTLGPNFVANVGPKRRSEAVAVLGEKRGIAIADTLYSCVDPSMSVEEGPHPCRKDLSHLALRTRIRGRDSRVGCRPSAVLARQQTTATSSTAQDPRHLAGERAPSRIDEGVALSLRPWTTLTHSVGKERSRP